IATLSAIARPTVGVVTMVAAVHTEFLGTIEGVREEKAALVRALSPAGIAVLNADDPRVASMAREAKGRVVTFGRAAHATVRIAGEATDTEAGFAFTLEAGAPRRPPRRGRARRHAGAGRAERRGAPRGGPRRRRAARGRARGVRPRRRARRRGRARGGIGRSASRADVRGHGGAPAQAADAGRRRAREGFAGHAHGARGGRARGAAGPDRPVLRMRMD